MLRPGRLCVYGLVLLFCLPPALTFAEDTSYGITTRQDMSVRVNGRYVGHLYREVKMMLRPSPQGGYTGEVYRLQQTLRDMQQSARKIDAVVKITVPATDRSPLVPVRFPSADSKATDPRTWPLPFGSFPVIPRRMPEPGTTWDAESTYYADPLQSGKPIPIPFLCRYRFVAEIKYQGQDVYEVSAQFALRYPSLSATSRTAETAADTGLKSVSGSHRLTILVAKDGSGILLIRDLLEEQYIFSDGKGVREMLEGNARSAVKDPSAETTLQYGGFALTWFKGSTRVENDRIASAAENALGVTPESGAVGPASGSGSGSDTVASGSGRTSGAGGEVKGTLDSSSGQSSGSGAATKGSGSNSGTVASGSGSGSGTASGAGTPPPDVTVTRIPEGVRITLENVYFLPDSAEVVPQDASRLARVAAILKSTPERTIRVVGFTADVGNPTGQQKLSVERARAVVDYFTHAGIPASRFIYEGRGGHDPLASNATEAGRARNRRVEITILDN